MTSSPNTPKQGATYQSLGHKFVWLVLLCSVVVALFITALQTYVSYQYSLKELNHHFTEIENNYLPSLAAGMWSVDDERINTLLDGMNNIPDIGKLDLQGELNERWQRTHQDRVDIVKSKQFEIVYHEGEEQFRVGTLTVSLAADAIHDSLWKTAGNIAAITLVSLSVSAILVLFIFKYTVSRELSEISNYVQSLDLTKLENEAQLRRQAPQKQDEIDLVINALNTMRSRIREDIRQRDILDRELAIYREQLEQLVNERTSELRIKTDLLERKSEELLIQNRDLDAYAHTVAHDLKQPVSNLLGVSRILTSSDIELSVERTKNLLISVQKSATKMRAIIDSLLLLASIRKQQDLQLHNISLASSVHEAQHRLASFAQERKAEIHVAEDWPMVIGENQWLEEVWSNYLSNAIKYGGQPPKIAIDWELTSEQSVKCWVQDNGNGISADNQRELFEQFTRFDREAGEGHGLGLSIVKRIVQRLGGKVGYEQSSTGGSIFYFTLKLASNNHHTN